MNVIELKDIVKSYQMGDTIVYALNHVTVNFEKGKFTSIVGPSGSGKSTMMNILGCLDRPTSGEYILEGKNIANYTDDELAHTRNQKIGFVFQSFNLLNRLTAGGDVAPPSRCPPDISLGLLYIRLPSPTSVRACSARFVRSSRVTPA